MKLSLKSLKIVGAIVAIIIALTNFLSSFTNVLKFFGIEDSEELKENSTQTIKKIKDNFKNKPDINEILNPKDEDDEYWNYLFINIFLSNLSYFIY